MTTTESKTNLSVSIRGDQLKALLLHAAIEHSRYAIAGVLVEIWECGAARLTCTDGRRIARIVNGDPPDHSPAARWIADRDSFAGVRLSRYGRFHLSPPVGDASSFPIAINRVREGLQIFLDGLVVRKGSDIPGGFPPCDDVIPPSTPESNPVGIIGMDPRFMADAMILFRSVQDDDVPGSCSRIRMPDLLNKPIRLDSEKNREGVSALAICWPMVLPEHDQ